MERKRACQETGAVYCVSDRHGGLTLHPTSLENMCRCYEKYVTSSFIDTRGRISLLEIGGSNFNGSYRDVFSDPRVHYLAADLVLGEGVDIVLHDPYHIPAPDRGLDLVISGQTFEHCEFFWLTFQEMIRVVKEDGFVFLIAPSSGPIHRYPVDCYRFYPDSYAALAKYWRDATSRHGGSTSVVLGMT